MSKLKFYFPIDLQLALAIFSLMLVLFSFVLLFIYWVDYRNLESRLGDRLLGISATASVNINGDRHQSIRSMKDVDSLEFKEIYSLLSSIKTVNNLTDNTIYTFRVEDSDLNESILLAFTVMLHSNPFIGDYYEVPKRNLPYIKEVLKGHFTKTPIYKDAHGEWISAYAPIITSSGVVVGILEVDFDVHFFVDELEKQIIFLLALGILLAFILAIASYLVAKVFTESLLQLKSAFNIIEEGGHKTIDLSFDGKKPLLFEDEFSDLKTSFNMMLVRLREHMMMLSYLSIHTKEMITRSLSGELNESGELKEVVVLFSDIRGFSKFSDTNEPEFIISYLNKILGIQSNIIIEHGGYIDKYVGDEIIGIFEGDLAAEIAVLTAVRIQKSLKEKFSDKNFFPYTLPVGIGLHSGNMVMGNVGNEYRRDYTVIGANVNLGSRLVSAAKGGQILASEALIKRVKNKDSRFRYSLSRKYKFKGISKAVLTYLVSGTDQL